MARKYVRFVILGLLAAALLASGASAFTVIVHDAQVRVGSTANVSVEIDNIPVTLWYYKINLTITNPLIGEFVNVGFPAWVLYPSFAQNSTLPSDTLWMKGGTTAPVPAGTQNVSLGNVTVQGDAPGTAQITVVVDSMETDNGVLITPATMNGSLQVLPTTGFLTVTSLPDNAEIFLDGADTGSQTNTTLTGVAPGSHTVNVTLAGYKDAQVTVMVVAGETANADFVLEQQPATGTIRVTSVPSRAEIFIDGADTGKRTDATIGGIIAGDHMVRVSLAGYGEAEKTVKVIAGRTVMAFFILERLPGLPKAGFTAYPQQGRAPLTVSFKDLSRGNPTSWAWDFNNDGIIDSTDQNPTYTYTAPGVYTVNLTVTNAAGSDSEVRRNFIDIVSGKPKIKLS